MTTRVILLREILDSYCTSLARDPLALTTQELRDIIRDLDDIDPLRRAVRILRATIRNPGPNHVLHRNLVVRTKHEWPSLWRAILAAIKEIE